MPQRLLLGTRKGTFLVTRSNGRWRPRLCGHPGVGVNFVARDPHTRTLWAALGHGHWGAKLSRSDDDGASWADAAQVAFPEGARYLAPPVPSEEPDAPPAPTRVVDATVLKLWVLAFGAPGTVYVGTIPGGLFVSEDGGESFALNLGLWNHASRGGDLSTGTEGRQTHWFGTPASEGGEFAPGIHSILVDPRDPRRVMVAVSTAGVLVTNDGGTTWQGRNRGLVMDYMPDPRAEWGHDPHAIELCVGQPDHVWMQNHCGVFRSADGGESWRMVSDKDQGVHFGFPVATDAEDGRVAWVVPGKADAQRMAIDGGLFVARTEDGGESWQQLRAGLPQENAYDVVYRHALACAEDRLAFGTTTGNLYLSEDRGESWVTVANNLPPIYSVRFG